MRGYQLIPACTYGFVWHNGIRWDELVGQTIKVSERYPGHPDDRVRVSAGTLVGVVTHYEATSLIFHGMDEFVLDAELQYQVSVLIRDIPPQSKSC